MHTRPSVSRILDDHAHTATPTLSSRLPPGPRQVPLLGNAHEMKSANPLRDLHRWRQQFGDVYSIGLMGLDVVVVRVTSGFKLPPLPVGTFVSK